MRKFAIAALLSSAVFGCSKKEDTDTASQPAPVILTQEHPDVPGDAPQNAPVVIQSPEGQQYRTGLAHNKLKEIIEAAGYEAKYATFAEGECDNLPESFDLRDPALDRVSGVRNQGNAGTCWAHSMVGSLESARRGLGFKDDLSEQELVSCDSSNWGVEGGLLGGFKYLIQHGTSLESDYPYTSGQTGRNGQCKTAPVAAKGVSYLFAGAANRSPTEKEMQCILFKYKTVPWVTVGATGAWGSPPSSEQIAYTRCGAAQTNHAIGYTGWHKDAASGKIVFHAKNSWGKWGANSYNPQEGGYMSLPRMCNNFGEEVAIIQVAQPPTPTPTPTPPGPTPTPSPCAQVPKVKLPPELQVLSGEASMLGNPVEEAGVTYQWFAAGVAVAGETHSMINVSVTKDTVYKLQGKNACGTSESQTRVRVVQSKK